MSLVVCIDRFWPSAAAIQEVEPRRYRSPQAMLSRSSLAARLIARGCDVRLQASSAGCRREGCLAREADLSPTERLTMLMDHLGLGVAHFGTPIPRDISGMAADYPGRLGGVVLCVPSRLDPAPFTDIDERGLMISGERGPAAAVPE